MLDRGEMATVENNKTTATARRKPASVDVAKLAAERVAKDLQSYLLKSEEPRRRLRFLATKTGIHAKTLQRMAQRRSSIEMF